MNKDDHYKTERTNINGWIENGLLIFYHVDEFLKIILERTCDLVDGKGYLCDGGSMVGVSPHRYLWLILINITDHHYPLLEKQMKINVFGCIQSFSYYVFAFLLTYTG